MRFSNEDTDEKGFVKQRQYFMQKEEYAAFQSLIKQKLCFTLEPATTTNCKLFYLDCTIKKNTKKRRNVKENNTRFYMRAKLLQCLHSKIIVFFSLQNPIKLNGFKVFSFLLLFFLTERKVFFSITVLHSAQTSEQRNKGKRRVYMKNYAHSHN